MNSTAVQATLTVASIFSYCLLAAARDDDGSVACERMRQPCIRKLPSATAAAAAAAATAG